MMNESSVKTPSCLAITENRQQQRPGGGCVGIFFQLFDWNRRFAKKKLFSRKLLPPARAKQASKRFAFDEKMPKIKPQLTIEKNSEDFPSHVKKNVKGRIGMEQKHDMKTPNLVARLMGLESMPTIQLDKPKTVGTFSTSYDNKEEKVVNFNGSVRSGEDLSLEKGSTSRPQKIRKTEPSERRAVTRFCTESLQIKNVLSRSRKHHHPKLLSPEKSPRISSSRSSYRNRTSRLIDAAAKILEPGLQNRAKCALTYKSSTNYTQKDELLTEEIVIISPHLIGESGRVRDSINRQTSYANNGNFLSLVDSQQKFDRQPFVYQAFALNLDSEFGKDKQRTSISSHERETEVVFGKNRDRPRPAQEKDNKCSRGESSSKRKSQPLEGSVQCHTTKQLLSKPHKGEQASIVLKHRSQNQKQIFSSRDRTPPPRIKSSNSKCRKISSTVSGVSPSKDFVSTNRSISGQMQITKVDNSTLEMHKRSSNRKDEFLSPAKSTARKKQIVGANRQVEGVVTQANMDLACITRQEKVIRSNGNGENNVNSFTFSSPARHKSRISAQKEKRKVQCDSGRLTSQCRETASYENKSYEQKADKLGVLLQQKLKELTSEEEDELTVDSKAPKRSTAMILQELISALTIEKPDPHDGNMYNRDILLQSKTKTGGRVVESSCNGDHLSPGSVLEASFSNGSCFSSSLDDYSVSEHRPFDSMDCPVDQLLDSATSTRKNESGYELVSKLINQISTTLDSIIKSIDLEIGLSGSKLMHAKAVILDAEIMFNNATQQNLNAEKHLLVGPSLLETLAESLSTDLHCHLGFEEDNQMKGFLFDCLVEYLDSKICQYSNSRYKIPPCMNSELLIRDFGIEFRKWTQTQFASMIPDELIEWEISHSLAKCTDFQTEGFEIGVEMDRDILQVLVEEIVVDFL